MMLSRTPVKCRWIDEIRCSKSGEPCTEKTNRRGETESIRAKPLRGEFSSTEPCICCNHSVISHNVQDGDTNDDLKRVSIVVPMFDIVFTFPVDLEPGWTVYTAAIMS